MKDGVILRVSKPARMGIDDSGRKALRPPIQHKLFAPQLTLILPSFAE
jgi:hypothetical protein